MFIKCMAQCDCNIVLWEGAKSHHKPIRTTTAMCGANIFTNMHAYLLNRRLSFLFNRMCEISIAFQINTLRTVNKLKSSMTFKRHFTILNTICFTLIPNLLGRRKKITRIHTRSADSSQHQRVGGGVAAAKKSIYKLHSAHIQTRNCANNL